MFASVTQSSEFSVLSFASSSCCSYSAMDSDCCCANGAFDVSGTGHKTPVWVAWISAETVTAAVALSMLEIHSNCGKENN